jgi:hypothetical protein
MRPLDMLWNPNPFPSPITSSRFLQITGTIVKKKGYVLNGLENDHGRHWNKPEHLMGHAEALSQALAGALRYSGHRSREGGEERTEKL